VKIQTVEVKREPLDLDDKALIELDGIEWKVITPDNQSKVFEDLKKEGSDTVLFGLTDRDYENLAKDNAKILGVIEQLKGKIRAYKKYYESTTK
jgi:hypothetical protein